MIAPLLSRVSSFIVTVLRAGLLTRAVEPSRAVEHEEASKSIGLFREDLQNDAEDERSLSPWGEDTEL